MVTNKHTLINHAPQPSPNLYELLTAVDYVDLHPLVDVLSPPERGKGRRLTQSLAKVKAFLISRYPGSGLPQKDKPLQEALADEKAGIGELFGFAPGKTPDRTRLREAFNRLERHLDLVADATGALALVLRERPWEPDDGVVFEPRPRGPQRGSNVYRRQRKERRLALDRFLQSFQTDGDVLQFFVSMRWPDGIRCLKCGGDNIVERKNHRPQP